MYIVKHVGQCQSPSGASLIFTQDLHVIFLRKMFHDKYIIQLTSGITCHKYHTQSYSLLLLLPYRHSKSTGFVLHLLYMTEETINFTEIQCILWCI